MHGNEVAAPLKVTPYELLVLFKEAAGLTTIPFPTVKYSLTEIYCLPTPGTSFHKTYRSDLAYPVT